MLLLCTFKLYDDAILLSHAVKACRLSGSTDIPVKDSARHTYCSRIAGCPVLLIFLLQIALG